MIRSLFKRFHRDEGGNVSIEMCIWLPLIITTLGATFSLFEAFRQQSLNVKAAYTISDALSRQTDPIDDAYLDGMHDVLQFLTDSDGHYGLRVTVVRYDATSNAYDVAWSEARGDWSGLNSEMLVDVVGNLPQLLGNERVILVETETEHNPTIDVPYLSPETFYNFVFTRPRFAPQLLWQG